MRLSKTTIHALQAVLQMAAAKPETPLTCRELATEDGVPERYLMNILRTLHRRGLVESVRGSSGGFRLDCDPSRISLLDIVEAIDGPLLARLPTGSNLPEETSNRLCESQQQIVTETRRQLSAVQVSELIQPLRQRHTRLPPKPTAALQSTTCLR